MNHSGNSSNFNSLQRINQAKERIETLKREKNEKSALIARIKRQLAEIEIQEEELQREVRHVECCGLFDNLLFGFIEFYDC